MRLKVRIYNPFEEKQSPRPVATVIITDNQERACWHPKHIADEAQFFLERVETKSQDIEQRIRSVLQQPFITVSRSGSQMTGEVSARIDYSAEEPHGTPAYWRAAIGQLKRTAGLTEDLEDYGRMLQKMEAALPIAEEPELTVADRRHVLRQCSFYILNHLGDGLWAGEPVYDENRKQWRVPLHSRSLSADVTLSEMTLDVRGKICHAPSRRDLQPVMQKYLRAEEPS